MARDNGEHLVLGSRTLQPLPPALFAQDPGNQGARASLGQPAISHRYVQFTSDRGLFVYQMESPPPAT